MRILTLLFMVSAGLFGLPSFAGTTEDKGSFKSTKIGYFQQNYSGAANKSFANGSPGQGVELTLDDGYSLIRYFFRARFISAEGQQNFLNGSTVFNSKYKYSQFAPEIGVSLFPIPRKDRGLNIFVWVTGNTSYHNLEIKTLPAGSTLNLKEQTFGFGFGGGLGLEYIVGHSRDSRYLVYGEVGFREEYVKLTKRQFELSGMTASVGIGF